jgi:hypothetical protein
LVGFNIIISEKLTAGGGQGNDPVATRLTELAKKGSQAVVLANPYYFWWAIQDLNL